MKYIYTLFISLVISSSIYAQPCAQNLYLNTQAEVDAFAVNFPNCTEILGTLSLSNLDSDIHDLEPLSKLEKIGGSVYIQSQSNLTDLSPLNNINHIGGNLAVSNSAAVNIPFQSLEYLASDLTVQANDNLIDFTGFPLLDSLWGDINIFANENLVSIDALNHITKTRGIISIHLNPALESIGGFNSLIETRTVQFVDNPILSVVGGFDNLLTIDGIFNFSNNDDIIIFSGLSNVRYIDNDIIIRNNDILREINGFPLLEFVGEDILIEFNDSLKRISGFPSLLHIVESLDIKSNYGLHSIEGFDTLRRIDETLNFYECYQLTTINAFEAIDTVGSVTFRDTWMLEDLSAFSPITKLNRSLNFRNCLSLTDLSGFHNVSTVGRTLSIQGNPKLQNLDPLAAVKDIGAYLYIKDNNMLTSIEGLTNVHSIGDYNPTGVPELTIEENDLLSDCQIRLVCMMLHAPGVEVDINTNAPGCNDINEIFCADAGLGGFVYFDANQNGNRDLNEFGIPNQIVRLDPDDRDLYSNDYGLYYYYAEDNNDYKLTWISDPNWTLTSDSTSYDVNFSPALGLNEAYLFALHPNYTAESAGINIASEQTRCDDTSSFNIRLMNTGTENLLATATFRYHAACRFVDASVAPTTIDTLNQILTWDFNILYPFEIKDIEVELEMPNYQFTGDRLKYYVETSGSASGAAVLLDSMTYESVLRCSYDPNDKLVNPIGAGSTGIIPPGTPLHYTLRFQNTGNAPAINVRVEDSISDYLDLSTFRLVNNSHPVTVHLEDRVMTFNFNNIWLPDSTSNEAASHGFVSFEISPIAGLPDPTVVHNAVDIYFDQNPAVRTNQTTSTYSLITNVENGINTKLGFKISPNPVEEVLSFESLGSTSNDGLIYVLDIHGKLILSTPIHKAKKQVDVSNLPSGLYIIQYVNDGLSYSQKFVKQ